MYLLVRFAAVYLLKNAIVLIIRLNFFMKPCSRFLSLVRMQIFYAFGVGLTQTKQGVGPFTCIGYKRNARFQKKCMVSFIKGIFILLGLFMVIGLFIFLLPRALPFALAISEITIAILAGIGLAQIINIEK